MDDTNTLIGLNLFLADSILILTLFKEILHRINENNMKKKQINNVSLTPKNTTDTDAKIGPNTLDILPIIRLTLTALPRDDNFINWGIVESAKGSRIESNKIK